MFPNDMDFMVLRERQQDLLREVERDRLARSVERTQAGDHKIVQRAIVWMGDRLVRWGWALQRYGTIEPIHPLPMSGESKG